MRIVSANITGSVIVNGVDVTDALTSTSENSGSISQKLDSLQSSTSSLNSFTSSINTTIKDYINSETVISGSAQVLITGTTGYSTFSSSISTSIGSLSSSVATTTSDLSSSIGALSGSVATTTSNLSSSVGSLSSSVATTTSGLAGRIVSVENKTGSYATTGSNIFSGNQVITGSFNQLGDMCVTGNITSTGQIIAQTINVQQVTSSIVYSCGSNIFGNDLSNTQQFTGSLQVSGSTHYLFGDVGIGTDLPSQKLHVNAGHVAVNAGYGLVWSGGADRIITPEDNVEGGLFKVASGAATRFLRASTESMRINGDGNVGIGTCSPSVTLQAIGTIASGDDVNGWGRFSFDNDVVKLQASKNGTDAISMAFSTQASGGGFAERMRITGGGLIGVNTTTPAAEFQLNKNCDVVLALSNCINVTTGNRGTLAFYNCATSTVAMIRAAAVTDNVGTELQFHTRPSAGELTQVMTLHSNGNVGVGTAYACSLFTVKGPFSGGYYPNPTTLCPLANFVGSNPEVLISDYSNGAGRTATLRLGTPHVDYYCYGAYVRAVQGAGIDVYSLELGTSNNNPATTKLTINSNGVVNFANNACMSTLIANNSSTFAACITSCSTDYSMYIRNMSSGFPLSIYTTPDSNGVNDDLKAIKIARASNDNQYLAVSLIHGGFGYGYKFTPRYYNGSAYVCGAPTVIDAYGNIGINCTAPFMPLTVKGCAGIDRLVINCAGFNVIGEHLQVRGCARFFGGNLRISDSANDGNYMFLQHDDTNGYLCICRTIYAGNLILSAFGGVGINTSVVTTKLSVNSGISTSSANVLSLQQATNGAVKDAVGFGVSIQNGGESTNAADLYISTATGGALCERMRITSGGSIGINNSSPDSNSRLDVNGQAFVARLAVYNDNGTPSLGTSPILYSPASATLGISMGTAERVRISTTGTCFSCLVYTPAICQPSGFVVYSFPVNYGASFVDVTSGNYLSIGGTEPGTVNSYCAYAHGGISPRAVATNTETMSWTCLRFVLRVLSPVGDTAGTSTYLQTAGYFYSTGFYGIGSCINIAGVMDGSRGYSTVVLPWIPYSSFTNSGDVTGFGIRNVGPTTTRIGSVFIQYK